MNPNPTVSITKFAMTSLPASFNISTHTTFSHSLKKRSCFRLKFPQPTNSYCFSGQKISSFHENEFNLRNFDGGWSFLEKNGNLMGVEGWRRGNKKRVIVVRVNQFGFNGGGGGGRDNSNNSRVLVNLALAIGLTYLSMTGQLGWVLDAIVSVWLLAVILPIAGLGAFLWWAGRNIVQGSCPNCGKDFQIFRSSLKDGLQLCPYCTQPFSVEGDEFAKEPANFNPDRSTTFGQAFNGFSSSSKKGKPSSLSVVDIEAEVKDVE